MTASPAYRQEKHDGYGCVYDIFARARALYPRRPALVIAGRVWDYGELGNLVCAAASRMEKIVPTTGGRVAIIGENSLSYIAAFWAAQQLGFTTVEISRDESLKTQLGVLRTTQSQFVVTDREDLKQALNGNIPTESFEEFLSGYGMPGGGAVEVPSPVNGNGFNRIPQDGSVEASIVYTSGTTASPKGIVLSHGNLCFIARAVAGYLELTEEDRCALALPLCHTYGKSVMLSAFAAGAAVVALEGFGNLRKSLPLMASERCTVLCAVPYHLNTLVKSGGLSKYDFSSLRAVTSSADRLPLSVIDSLEEALPGVRIFSMYGLTESATRACYLPPEFLRVKKGSCGRPLPGVEIRIAAEGGGDAPAGVPGEVLLRGPNIMKGYFGDPCLTAETVVNGWLKTGDIGYLDGDGFLYIDGRKKDIIKCAGERVSPAEIEEALMEHPCVEEAAVVGQRDSLMGEIIHAYVTAHSPLLKISDLREHCAARLSPLKVPYLYTIVESFPRTGTGKIQKNLLRG